MPDNSKSVVLFLKLCAAQVISKAEAGLLGEDRDWQPRKISLLLKFSKSTLHRNVT